MMKMETRCNILTYLSVTYTFYVWFKLGTLTAAEVSIFGLLLLDCLFILISTKTGNVLRNQSNYRPNVDPNPMCVMLVPLCLINENFSLKLKQDFGTGLEDIQLCLSVTAVIITKYYFQIDRPRLPALMFLSASFMVLLSFSHFTLLPFYVVTAFIAWKSLDFIRKMTPKSFSFAEMSICVQLSISLAVRMLREIMKMEDVLQEEHQLKWIGSTAVVAIFFATVVTWMLKAYRSAIFILVVYTCFALASLIFLMGYLRQNLFLLMMQLLLGDCTVGMLLLSWVVFCAITVIWTIVYALQSSKASNSSVSLNTRKVFHLFILLVYIPGLLLAPHVLFLASTLAFGAFIVVEAVRVFQVPGMGHHLDSILRTFVDERDQGVLFLTHFYLLVGLSIPIWITYSPLNALSPIKLYSGVLSLGIGDTVACVAGKAFGRNRWKGTIKTFEGTFSSVAAQLTFIYLYAYFGYLPEYSAISVVFGVVHGALYEAFTDQIDNLVLPLALFPFLC